MKECLQLSHRIRLSVGVAGLSLVLTACGGGGSSDTSLLDVPATETSPATDTLNSTVNSAPTGTVNNVAAAGQDAVLVSRASDRSGAFSLDGEAVDGNIYVFTGSEASIERVEFFIDNVDATGTADKIEKRPPYDLGGSLSDGSAAPFDTTWLADGVHTLTTKLTLRDGTTQTLTTEFTVANNNGSANIQSGSVSLNWVAPAERVDGASLSLTEIAEYRIYYGENCGQYTSTLAIDDPYASSAVIRHLPLGSYCFVMTTVDVNGLESGYSARAVIEAQT
jgi:hypothetical protein